MGASPAQRSPPASGRLRAAAIRRSGSGEGGRRTCAKAAAAAAAGEPSPVRLRKGQDCGGGGAAEACAVRLRGGLRGAVAGKGGVQ